MSNPSDFSYLLAEASKQFAICQEQIVFGDHSIEYYRPADPESVLDDETLLSPHDELQWQPYWAQAWDAAVGICHYLADQPLQGQQVLDLGCGIGLTVRIVAGHRRERRLR